MSKIVRLFGFLAVVPFLLTGCGAEKPAGFPDTVPFSIKIEKEGRPLVDAQISLYSESGVDYAVGGTTDENGVAELATVRGSYARKGAPLGTFAVTVNKLTEVPGTLSFEETAALTLEELMKYAAKMEEERAELPPEVAEEFTSQETTPLSVTVTSGGSETLTVE